MIVASLLLIPVAVLFLALGLINGSSSLLIASIVVSLLAAVALVIGARQAAVSRRAAKLDQPERPGPMPGTAPAAHPGPDSWADEEPDAWAADPRRDDSYLADDSAPVPAPSAAESVSYADPAFADQVGAAHVPPRADSRSDSSPLAEYAESDSAPVSPGSEYQPDYGPDYDRATATIDAVRDPEDHSWRRPAEAGDAVADEFDEPDEDDPDDEPLPQSVRPADAVVVARLDTEVLVVDGRPRYHMADCPHLVGRLTEPLPVNEAVELGFGPCGLCRPVDRLVAAAAHR